MKRIRGIDSPEKPSNTGNAKTQRKFCPKFYQHIAKPAAETAGLSCVLFQIYLVHPQSNNCRCRTKKNPQFTKQNLKWLLGPASSNNVSYELKKHKLVKYISNQIPPRPILPNNWKIIFKQKLRFPCYAAVRLRYRLKYTKHLKWSFGFWKWKIAIPHITRLLILNKFAHIWNCVI